MTATGEGGLGNRALRGWYGLGGLKSRFGASSGDQATGGQISFGLPGDSNRALGLLSTTSTGPTAFGAKFVNTGTNVLHYISLEFTGELWRQSDLRKTILVSYYMDPTGTNGFSTSNTAPIPGVAIDFAADPSLAGGTAVDGTSASNQQELGVTDQPIPTWAPGAALWLVWQMSDAAGKAQGIAVDNLQFSATIHPIAAPQPPLSIGLSNTDLLLTCPSVPGWAYQLQFKSSLDETNWIQLGAAVAGTGAPLSFTNGVQNTPQGFYRLRVLP